MGTDALREPGIIKTLTWPFSDLDVSSISYNAQGKISEIVITGLGQTKTLVFSYDGNGNLTSVASVIT